MLDRLFQIRLIESIFYGKHSRVIRRMENFGYPEDDDGICFGIANMGVIAILADDVKKFNDRLEWIDKYSTNVLATKVEEEKQKQIYLLENEYAEVEQSEEKLNAAIKKQISEKVNAHRTEQEIAVLEIPAFFDGVHLLANPYLYQHLFESKQPAFCQDAEHVFLYILPKKLDASGGIIKADAYSGLYGDNDLDDNDLEDYFSSIESVIGKSNIPFAMVLTNTSHAITIGYDYKSHHWVCIDANQLPVKYITTNAEAKEFVLKAFRAVKKVALTTTIFTTQQNREPLQKMLKDLEGIQKWKNIHAVTKAKADSIDDNGDSWLDCATQTGNVAVVKALLNENLSINMSSALQQAVQKNYIDIARHILEKRKKDEHPKHKTTPQKAAAFLGNIEMMRLLLEFEKVELHSSEGLSPLSGACVGGHMEIVKFLLDSKANINNLEEKGYTPLMLASGFKHENLALFLLRNGANPHALDFHGESAVILAATQGADKVILELIKHKVSINQLFQANTEHLLSHAQSYNRKSSVQSLLQTNYKLMIPKYIPKMTALHMAAFCGCDSTVKLLIENGADITIQSENGLTALQMAEAMGHANIVNIIKLESYRSVMLHVDSVRSDAINALLQNVKEIKSCEQTTKQLEYFTAIDELAVKLKNISSEYSSKNRQRNISINALNDAIFAAYKSYADNPNDATIFQKLKSKADRIAGLVKEDHEAFSFRFKLYGKKSKLENKIIEAIQPGLKHV